MAFYKFHLPCDSTTDTAIQDPYTQILFHLQNLCARCWQKEVSLTMVCLSLNLNVIYGLKEWQSVAVNKVPL